MQQKVKLETAEWEITAISLRCDYIADVVTVRVSRDWLAKCAWYLKYKQKATKESEEKIDKVTKHRIGKCVGPDCSVVTKYREKLIEEEFGKR